MKQDSSKDKMKADSSTVGKYTDVELVNSNEQKMDSVSYCKFVYSTPQVGKTDNDMQGSVTLTVRSSYSLDSGISDTFNSTWTSSIDTSSLSAECSPQSETGNQRLALKACECSPIKRVSSTCIQGRRLTFTEADFQAVELSALEIHASKSQTEFCEKSEEIDDLTVEQPDSLPVLTSLRGNYDGQSCFSSPDSAIDDGLEVSLQEMALGEFSSEIVSTPLNLKSTKCDGAQQSWACLEQKHALPRGSRTFTRSCPCCHHRAESCRDRTGDRTSRSQSSQTEAPILKYSPYWPYKQHKCSGCFHTEALHHRTDAKLKHHSKLSLASTSPQNPQTLGHAAAEQAKPYMAEHSTAAFELFPDPRISPDGELPQTCADVRVPCLPYQQYTLSWSMADPLDRCDSTVKSNTDNHKCLTPNHSQTLIPSKRSSDFIETSSFTFGPPKVRRTHMLIKEGRASVGQVSRKSASGKTLLDHEDSFVLDCNTLDLDHLHLYNSSTLHLTDQRPVDEVKSMCDIQLEKPGTAWFHSLYGKNNQVIEKETAIDINNEDCVRKSLRELKKLCPYETNHLIGRNVGLGKFDIVCELYQQNFYLCLEAIFSHLADNDLASLVGVSTSWKLAVHSEHKAYNRYRQHKRSLSMRNLQHGSGKENTGEKPAGAPSSHTLTQPRGLLSSIQSQAQAKVVPDPPTTIVAKDVLMFDDTLRVCPHCQGPAKIKPCQDRALCLSNKCSYDFCTLCFTTFHHPRPCKPLCKAPSRADLAGTKKSKKNLKRL